MISFLMCPPTHYQVSYRINEWMQPTEWQPEYQKKAQKQWEALYDAIIEAGAEVRLEWPEPDCPDMVFTANHALVVDRKAIIAEFFHTERQHEKPHIVRHFNMLQKLGVVDHVEWSRYHFEGRGDCIYHNKRIYVSTGGRTWPDRQLYRRVWPDYDIFELKLTNPYLYHLDTCFCPLSDNTLIYYPDAFENLNEVLPHFDHLIKLSYTEAMNFAANSIEINKKIIMPNVSGRLAAKLQKRGFEVALVNMSAFLKAGGAAACCVLKIED